MFFLPVGFQLDSASKKHHWKLTRQGQGRSQYLSSLHLSLSFVEKHSWGLCPSQVRLLYSANKNKQQPIKFEFKISNECSFIFRYSPFNIWNILTLKSSSLFICNSHLSGVLYFTPTCTDKASAFCFNYLPLAQFLA